MKKTQIKPPRIHGLDLLRVILSMCVVTIHILHYGGFRTHSDPSNPGFYLLWLWGIIINCTVNCFAIISGFALYDHDIKCTNIFHLFLTVVYHSIFITITFWIFFPEKVAATHWFQALFPISYDEFWYFTSYFGVFFFIPILSRGIQSLPKNYSIFVVFKLILIFSFIPTFSGRDPFSLNRGYSALWVLVLAIIGMFLRKYYSTFRISKPTLIWIFVGCILITCIGVVLSIFYPSVNGMVLIEYTSPTIVFAAIAVILFFSSLRVPPLIQKFSSICVPFTFSIYLLHEHPLVRQNIILDRFISVLTLPATFQIISVLAITVIVWSCCFVLEYIRQVFFHIMKIDKLLQRMENFLQIWIYKT